jgi:L-asparaginase
VPGPIAYFALGGTISMTGDAGGGVVARLDGCQLLETLGALPFEVEVKPAKAVPSASLSFADVLEVVAAAERAVAEGCAGVVVSQGTDTLEETAFLVDSVWSLDVPFVLTGAMRNPTLPGADGPANLLAALQVAATPAALGQGAVVVMADEIHAARHVRKVNTVSPGAFVSPDSGPLGHVVEGTPRWLTRVPSRTPVIGWTPGAIERTRVALYTVSLDDDGLLLSHVLSDHHGLVLAGAGAGHVPSTLVDTLAAINDAMPVVLTSRTGAGAGLVRTYGAPGAERDLLARGLISGGFAHPLKARILLRLLLAAGAGREDIAAAFAALG